MYIIELHACARFLQCFEISRVFLIPVFHREKRGKFQNTVKIVHIPVILIFLSLKLYLRKSKISDADDIYTTLKEVFITPKIEDHGKKVFCEGTILDKEGNELYPTAKPVEEFLLDVKFPPQDLDKGEFEGVEGEDLTISYKLKANPEPSEVKWIISVKETADSGNDSALRAELENATVVELTPGKTYTASQKHESTLLHISVIHEKIDWLEILYTDYVGLDD